MIFNFLELVRPVTPTSIFFDKPVPPEIEPMKETDGVLEDNDCSASATILELSDPMALPKNKHKQSLARIERKRVREKRRHLDIDININESFDELNIKNVLKNIISFSDLPFHQT